MPEQIENKTVFTLKEVAQSIQKTIAQRYGSHYWIMAEMNKLNYYKHSGHCYPELVQKEEGKVVAQLSATLWKQDFIRINQNFRRLLNEPLKEGIKVLILASISFEPMYGMTLKIQDIDPSYTLGDLEKEKQETLKMLYAKGVFYQNKNLPFPILPKRLAIISVETSKGYADFIKIIEKENQTYKFFHMLFPSLLQGDKAVKELILQLNKIRKVKHHFDVVCIVRGGGGDIGLSCFNHPELALSIATFPLPILTGIGHATNSTVVEEVAHYNAITPSQLGGMLLKKFEDFSEKVVYASNVLHEKSKEITEKHYVYLNNFGNAFSGMVRNTLLKNNYALEKFSHTITGQAINRIEFAQQSLRFIPNRMQQSIWNICNQKQLNIEHIYLEINKNTLRLVKNKIENLNQTEHRLKLSSPTETLKRGYSITYIAGKSVKNIDKIKEGDKIRTQLHEGEIESIITKIIAK